MFLPTTPSEIASLGWDGVDFILVTGDAYVDHPSFAAAVISRVLESESFRVAVLPQPDYKNADAFRSLGMPKLGFLVSAGNVDPMVAHYTSAKKPRKFDAYSPKGEFLRPDRATVVYCNRIREAFKSKNGDINGENKHIPIIIGSIEASLRRFAHFDYHSDTVRRSILIDSGADILVYGMGERAIKEIAHRLKNGGDIKEIKDIRGTAYIAKSEDECVFDYVTSESYESIRKSDETSKLAYARAFAVQYGEQDAVRGKAVIQRDSRRVLIQNPPQLPLSTMEMDAVYGFNYMRKAHPMYDSDGGIAALEEVEFSIIHNRGCFGECNFCALTFHQGRMVSSRSEASIIREAELISQSPGFKGYIHDVGGPTANFRKNACSRQSRFGACKDKRCLSPKPCKNLEVDHSEYLRILTKLSEIKGVKKVFVRSGVRFDYIMLDKDDSFLSAMVKNHVSGQLKVAPEHICPNVLNQMGKPCHDVYQSFSDKFYRMSKKHGLKQYLVPYLMSSHPGSTTKDALTLNRYLLENNLNPEQVQDFYPTPGTVSTCMFFTGINPITMQSVYVAKKSKEKALQRALLQPNKRRSVDKRYK